MPPSIPLSPSQPRGEATAAASPAVAMMQAAQRKAQQEAEERARKEAQEAAQEARSQEAMQINRDQNARAAAAAEAEQAQTKRAELAKTAAGDIAVSAPAYGVQWDKTPDYVRKDFQNRYGADALADAPKQWDSSLRQPKQQVVTGPDQKPYIADIESGEAKPINFGEPPKEEQAAPTATGEAALQGLTDDEKNMVRQIANYELPATILSRIPGNQKMRILARVDQYEPTFSANEYPARQSLKTSLKSGVMSQNIAAANTAVAHLNTLMEKAGKLNNRAFTPWNAVTNNTGKVFGEEGMTDFNNAANAVVSELAKVFKGAGVVPQQELNHWRENLSPNMSPAQIKGAIQTALELMGGRFAAIEDTYSRGMGKPKDFTILNNRSRAILRKNGYDPDHLESASGAPAEQQGEAKAPGAAPEKPKTVRQNGVTYELQPDGSYK